uniref:Vomeronasal type-1 receptor n=1 Tax=Latimeria chalumnae TaxID=7897 RepID=H3BH61_LATCH
MDLRAIMKATSFLVLTVIGIPGNFTVLAVFSHIAFTEYKLLPTDIIVTNLALVNFILVISRGFPQILTAFQLRNLFDTFGCKLIIFAFRIARALSISMTFLLSASQSVTISPATSRLSFLKQRLPKYLWPLIVFFWLLSGATSVTSILYSTADPNSTASQFTFNLEYCYVAFPGKDAYEGNGTMYVSRDLTFVILMALASIYILFVLYRHSQQVKSIRNPNRNQGTSAESRAAKTVVTLVALYVIFFGVDNLIWIYSISISRVSPMISDIRVFFSSLYATVSPIVIICSNKKIINKLYCTRRNQVSQAVEIIFTTV